ncbi:GCN5-related N-acetyltransferase [Desulfosarcina variabilis str. Montpellier]|uniref:GNAT family N-acetyltransferase n=1 Tax=Desulfosarcina variabilis TaxID=2300 RepID=UPI003AFA30F4
MTDLLVKLYDQQDSAMAAKKMANAGILVRRAMASEKYPALQWVNSHFGDGWAAECDVAFSRQPIGCIIAVAGSRVVGFACYDTTCLNFLGPIGVDQVHRQQGVGRMLLHVTLQAMANMGYAYAIIGGAGPVAFFESCVGAIPIPESTPGIYRPAIK